MKKILVLGGTNFIGRSLVEYLQKHPEAYDLTLLNRGVTNSDLFPSIKQIKGDRNTNEIGALVKGDWDIIIDVSCYFPRSIERIVNNVSKDLEHYIFISTGSVYDTEEKELIDETGAVLECKEEEYEDKSVQTYGKRKSACEDILIRSGIHYTILRPPIVYGEYDKTDRFYYWLYRVKHFDEILLPNDGQQKFSMTYVKDIVQAIGQSMIAPKRDEIYNITSHPIMTISRVIEIASKVLEVKPTLVNVDSTYLHANEVRQWWDLPLWIDNDDFTYDNQKILRDYELDLVELEESIRRTIAYYDDLNWPVPTYGLSREQEEDLLKKYETYR